MIDSKWYMEAEGRAREVCACRDILEWNGWGLARAAPGLTTISSVFVFVCVFVCLSPQTTDDIVSSAECSSDDEDLEECDSGHAGGMSVSSCACSETWSISPYLSLSCYRGASPPLASCPMGASSVTLKKKRPLSPLPHRKSSHSKHNGVLSVCQKFKEHVLETGESSKNALSTPSACSAVGSPTRNFYCV